MAGSSSGKFSTVCVGFANILALSGKKTIQESSQATVLVQTNSVRTMGALRPAKEGIGESSCTLVYFVVDKFRTLRRCRILRRFEKLRYTTGQRHPSQKSEPRFAFSFVQ